MKRSNKYFQHVKEYRLRPFIHMNYFYYSDNLYSLLNESPISSSDLKTNEIHIRDFNNMPHIRYISSLHRNSFY